MRGTCCKFVGDVDWNIGHLQDVAGCCSAQVANDYDVMLVADHR